MKRKTSRFHYLIKTKTMINCRAILFTLVVLISAQAGAQNLRAGSFNLRYDNPSDSLNNWQYRKNTIAGLIQFHDFDILGTQEGLENQLVQLKGLLPDYEYIGVGREDGKNTGEHSAIFYKTASFELLEKGDFWLSEDPSKPNKGWDAVLPRICSWGRFKDKSSGFTFYFFNTHFDHVGKVARSESAKLILEKIKQIAGTSPTLLTGDFNVDQNSASYKILNGSSILTDTYDLAPLKYGAEGSYNGFDINNRSESRIDHIFVTADFKVEKHGILTDTYQTETADLDKINNSGNYPKEISLYSNEARLPSDHYPILTVLTVKN